MFRQKLFLLISKIQNKLKKQQEHWASKLIQDTLDLSSLKVAKKVIVFLIPHNCKICGGVMSIFSLCQTSRDVVKEAFVTLVTYPNDLTYVLNDKFYNNEKVLRFEQIVTNSKNVQEMILHIPEYYADKFYKNLNKREIEFLKCIPNLQINIMNQNIELMPEKEKLQDLYNLTNNITQTIAHNRYATQFVCNKWGFPTHLFSVNIDLNMYKAYLFEEKEKIITLSPDRNEYREEVIKKLKENFPDWQILTIKNMSFKQFMDLIARSFFTITFGEGMDGYLNQPLYLGSLGLGVYNEKFFPDHSWCDLKNIYSSYADMIENICLDLKNFINNKELYYQTIKIQLEKLNKIYKFNNYLSNVKRFYKKEYDFVPTTKINQKGEKDDFVKI